ncbi:MAG: helix-turn-helix domain-containing protein [Mogibacterium sp.]|nr:helix-turn-helix domain-containing protein [Mogibacterium sp.]
MRLTDGKRTIEITMREWDGVNWGQDIAGEFFAGAELIDNDPYTALADIDYAIDNAKDWESHAGDYDDDDETERLVEITELTQIRRIRELTGLSMNKFSAKYNIPPRTLQDWEYGKNEAAPYLVDLLERAVREDYGLRRWYEVVAENNGDEFKIAGTYSRAEAIEACLREWNHLTETEKRRQYHMIRIYWDKKWLENEEYDYDVLEW